MAAYKTVPRFDVQTGIWDHFEFEYRKDFITFLWSQFKEPGLYEFDVTSREFNRQARAFDRNGYYCQAPENTKDFITYWDSEKNRCREGVLFVNGEKQWYLPRDYYMWINFLPIFNKEKNAFTFPDVRDVQYHLALYEELCKQLFKHAALLKKRQMASSYYHAGKMINYFWFEEGWINKMAGSLKDYINEKGTWRFLEEYRNFLNQYTAWYRPCTPDKVLNWEQKIETTLEGGRKVDTGLKSVIFGLVLDKDPTNGVGGPCSFFFHEEAGIAPKMNKTTEFLLPAMKAGMIYTGMLVAAGSVGELDQCEPLKEMILRPDSKDVLAVSCNLYDNKGTVKDCGLFIPEQWGMVPYVDKYGNSILHAPTEEQIPDLMRAWLEAGKEPEDFDPTVGAIKAIENERLEWKRSKTPADYQLAISQHPMNIEEAFATRDVSHFRPDLVNAQRERIKNKEYPLEYKDIFRNLEGKPQWKDTRALPIDEFPISPKVAFKEGAIVVHEHFQPGSSWGTYIGSIDPVGEGKTTTSDSLCSIYIYKNDVQVTRELPNGEFKHELEPGKLVAWWCGRFDDVDKTHERLSLMLEMYNAQAVVETNVPGFVNYMIAKHRQKYLVRRDQMLFLKELQSNNAVYSEYGWKNTGTTFKNQMIPFAAQMLAEEMHTEHNKDGEVISIRYGVERFADIMLFEEMRAYRDGLNVDRLIAFCALMSYVKIQRANRSATFVRRDVLHDNLQVSKKPANLKEHRSAFRNLENSSRRVGSGNPGRSPFRNLK